MKRLLYTASAVAALLFARGDQQVASALIEVGQPVPAFRLNDHTGAAVAIAADSKVTEGTWTVLAFYPKAATPG